MGRSGQGRQQGPGQGRRQGPGQGRQQEPGQGDRVTTGDAGRTLAPRTDARDDGRRMVELAAAAAQCRVELGTDTCDRLLAYLAMLEKWNAVYNLTAIRDREQMLAQHLLDSLAIVAPLREHGLLAAGARVLDVGSGAGLPGVVLALVEPAIDVHCVDAVAKKSAFVTQVAAELMIGNLHSRHARVEALRCGANEAMPAATLIVSRAFASLAEFVSLTAHLLAPGGSWAAMKGRMPDDELAALPATVSLAAAITLRVPRLDAQRHLLILQPR